MLLALLLSGCSDDSLDGENALFRQESQASLQITNGLATNGLATNGLATNGLATNGLSLSAMNGNAFIDWFNQNPGLHDLVMKYVVACAAKAGSSLTWRNTVTGIQYTWAGSLGLAPSWAAGARPTEVEQQVITACLAAHTNKYGVRVPLSVQGLDATGVPIPVVPQEFSTFSEKEACFFGNLFNAEGVYAGNDAAWPTTHSSVRACGLDSSNPKNLCPPIQHLSKCEYLCLPDAQRNHYLRCSYGGKSYRALNTRIRPQDIYRCGDGVCQFSESCGTGTHPDNCKDCGPCD